MFCALMILGLVRCVVLEFQWISSLVTQVPVDMFLMLAVQALGLW